MAAPENLAGTTWEGTWDEICEHAESLIGLRLRVEVLGPAASAPQPGDKQRQPTGFGRFAGSLSSGDVIRNKSEDLELEEQGR
jgi:hypothetical protein